MQISDEAVQTLIVKQMEIIEELTKENKELLEILFGTVKPQADIASGEVGHVPMPTKMNAIGKPPWDAIKARLERKFSVKKPKLVAITGIPENLQDFLDPGNVENKLGEDHASEIS